MDTRPKGWRINKDIIPECTEANKEYRWYDSTGWKLVTVKTINNGEEKPADVPGKVWKKSATKGW